MPLPLINCSTGLQGENFCLLFIFLKDKKVFKEGASFRAGLLNPWVATPNEVAKQMGFLCF